MTTAEQITDLARRGVGRYAIEATIGHKFDDDELAAFRRAQAEAILERSKKKERGPASAAERVRRHVAAANDLAEINAKPRHPRLKESCRYDLERFGWYYCRKLLKHRASKRMRSGLIRETQEAILHGGQSVKMYGRGGGKTTWVCHIAAVWAILYGHRRWPVIISANGGAGKANLRTIKRLLTRTEAIRRDFPEIAIPLIALGDISQRAASITHCGRPTDMEWSSDRIALPTTRNNAGELLGPGCGARVTSVGIGAAIRGANDSGQRPDFLILDDPQTIKIAHSPSMVESVIRYIHNDALSLSGHDRMIAAFVTITPQCFGDVATELTSRSKHPEWSVSIEPFIVRLCPDWSALADEFARAYQEDAAAGDYRRTRSTEWYKRNRDKFAQLEVIDDQQFDPSAEVDAVHHLLNLRSRIGEASFNAEIMMKVADLDSELDLNADRVAAALNGAPRLVLPPGTDSAVGFVDVNIRRNKGLSWGIVAFGPHRVSAVVAYGRYPERGALVPPGASDLVRNRAVAAALRVVTERIAALKLRDAKGRAVTLRALGFDRGYLPDVLHRALFVIRKTFKVPFPLVAVRGFPWNKFGTRSKDMLRRGDHVFATRSQYGEYLAVMSPYWREIMQSGFLETPLTPGSLSIYGSRAADHFEFANEVAAEKLVRKYPVASHGRTETAWDWICTGDNHFCDVLTGCFAIGSWYHCYDNLAAAIDSAALAGSYGYELPERAKKARQDDLFDPLKNPAVLSAAGYNGETDETEGTLDKGTAPHPSELERAPLPFRMVAAAKPKRPAKKAAPTFKRPRYYKR